MTTPALATVPSLRVPAAPGMLSCLAGYSPAFPETFPASARERRPLWSQSDIDTDLVHLEHDPELASKIMKRRQQERDRNNSRLAPRMQRTGLDIPALDMQVAQKQVAADIERDRDSHTLDGMNLKGALVNLAEAAVRDRLKQRHKECVGFSLANLGKHQRSEWELSDPQQLKKDKPGRVEGCPVAISSFQKFESEEGVGSDVLKAKRAAHLDWLMSQMAEKKAKEEQEKVRDFRHDEKLIEANDFRIACDLAAIQERQAEVLETARENVEMATARKARMQAAKERGDAATQKHMAEACAHNLMRERHDYTLGMNGKKRDYKRCSYEEEIQAWDLNRELVQARANRKTAQATADDGYHQIGATADILGMKYEEAWHQNNVVRRKRFDEANKALAQERREQNIRDKMEYTSFAPTL